MFGCLTHVPGSLGLEARREGTSVQASRPGWGQHGSRGSGWMVAGCLLLGAGDMEEGEHASGWLGPPRRGSWGARCVAALGSATQELEIEGESAVLILSLF